MMRIVIGVICLLTIPVAGAAQDFRVLPDEMDGIAPHQMMHEHLSKRVQEALDRREAEYEQLETPAQLRAHQQRMRRFFVAALGGFPERTPLKPRIVAKRKPRRLPH
jgi:hypothetical protein